MCEQTESRIPFLSFHCSWNTLSHSRDCTQPSGNPRTIHSSADGLCIRISFQKLSRIHAGPQCAIRGVSTRCSLANWSHRAPWRGVTKHAEQVWTGAWCHKLPGASASLDALYYGQDTCSLRPGYAPETLAFGKGLRVPGSLLQVKIPKAMRETARKAFHAADNDMSLRRAALSRDRPHRGAYEPGEWVMIWKAHLNQGSWIGPAKVIIQEGSTTVFCNNSGTLIRAAPEHICPASAVEAQLIPFEDQLQAVQRVQVMCQSPETPPTLAIVKFPWRTFQAISSPPASMRII